MYCDGPRHSRNYKTYAHLHLNFLVAITSIPLDRSAPIYFEVRSIPPIPFSDREYEYAEIDRKKNMERTGAGSSSLWWDMESCPLPTPFDPYTVTSMGSALLHTFNIIDVNAARHGCRSLNNYQFSAYAFFSPAETELYQTMINSGIRLQQLPPGQRNEMEKMMIADVLFWAMDTPAPANIIFIVGSVDFCYIFQKLWQRSYNIFLICPSASQIPRGMLSAANVCLEWLPFLGSLQDEDHQSRSPRENSVCDHTFSTAFPAASISVYETETFSTAFAASSTSVHDTEAFPAPSPVSSTSVHDSESFSPAFPASSTSVHDRQMEESNNASALKYNRETLLSLKPSLSGGWDGICGLPFELTGSSPAKTEPGFHGNFIITKKPRSPVSSASSTEKNKTASLEEFKAWLNRVVNSKKHAEKGYYIGPIHTDFSRATGMILDEKLLGFSDIRQLVEECKDIAVLKEVKRGCHLAFAVKPNEQQNPMFASKEQQYPNPVKKTKSKEKPKAETDSTRKSKASAEEFREFICHMLQAGEFSQGLLMSHLPQRFEQHTGKLLDVEHLGYKKLSALVASYSHLVSVGGAGPGPIRIFPSGFVSDPVPNLYPSSNTIEETPISRVCDPSNLKAKLEAARPSSGGSGKESLKNFNEQVPYMNSESEWLPSMTTGSLVLSNFSPFREANCPTFLQYTSIKSDSSSGPGGSPVSESEGQSSKTIDTTFFRGELAECNFVKQHDSILQRYSNNPIEEISVNAEALMAETMQNMRLKKEMTSFCGESNIHGDTVGLPDSIPPLSKSPSSELQAGYNSSIVDPLQSRSRAEGSAFCGEDLRDRRHSDCKENEQSTSVAEYEETSAVSSPESIIQIAARVLSSICEPTKWRKNA